MYFDRFFFLCLLVKFFLLFLLCNYHNDDDDVIESMKFFIWIKRKTGIKCEHHFFCLNQKVLQNEENDVKKLEYLPSEQNNNKKKWKKYLPFRKISKNCFTYPECHFFFSLLVIFVSPKSSSQVVWQTFFLFSCLFLSPLSFLPFKLAKKKKKKTEIPFSLHYQTEIV